MSSVKLHIRGNKAMALELVKEAEDKPEEVDSWYFTFGYNHNTREGDYLSERYVVIEGTHEEARQKMFETRGMIWAFQYPSADAAGVHQFCLKEITLGEVWLPEDMR